MWRELRRLAAFATMTAMLTACATTAEDASYLALGDSYTIGEGVAPAQRWPEVLAAHLRADGIAIMPPRVVARTGWTVAELDAAMDAERLVAPFDLVTLLIGVNDQYRGGDADSYRTALRVMLRRAVALAGARPQRVLMVSIPDWGATRFGAQDERGAVAIGAAIDAFNAVARTEAAALNVVFVDITHVSRSTAHRVQLAEDGLHPGAAQYAAWVTRIEPHARAALASP